LFPITAYASKPLSCDDGEKKTGKTWYHQHCYTDKDTHADRDDPSGVGIDLLITEGKNVDFVAEYRHDFNNDENSIFGVFKTKKALWDIVKGLFNKGE